MIPRPLVQAGRLSGTEGATSRRSPASLRPLGLARLTRRRPRPGWLGGGRGLDRSPGAVRETAGGRARHHWCGRPGCVQRERARAPKVTGRRSGSPAALQVSKALVGPHGLSQRQWRKTHGNEDRRPAPRRPCANHPRVRVQTQDTPFDTHLRPRRVR